LGFSMAELEIDTTTSETKLSYYFAQNCILHIEFSTGKILNVLI